MGRGTRMSGGVTTDVEGNVLAPEEVASRAAEVVSKGSSAGGE
jgi:hypothetical protein